MKKKLIYAAAVLLGVLIVIGVGRLANAKNAGSANFNRHVVCIQTKQAVIEYIAHTEIREGKKYAFFNVSKVVVFTKWPNPPHHPGACI